MLNRNNQLGLIQETRLDVEQKVATARQERLEAELRRMKEADDRKQREIEEESTNKPEQERNRAEVEVQAQREPDIDFDAKETLPRDSFASTNRPVVVDPPADFNSPLPPALMNLYGSYRIQENYFTETKSSEQVSTQPFSPQNSAAFSEGGEASETSSLRVTIRNSELTTTSVSLEKQETVEEVDDIAEDIEQCSGSDGDGIKDEDFDF